MNGFAGPHLRCGHHRGGRVRPEQAIGPNGPEIRIPFAGGAFPRTEVAAALERMGCVVSTERENAVTGFSSEWGSGRELTITAERGHLRVRSCFSDTRVYGSAKNQENVDRFKAEWERRTEVQAAAADPSVSAATEEKARRVARGAMWGGGLATAVGLGLAGLALFLPRREWHVPSGQYRLAGIGLLCMGYGLPRVMAAVRRLREPRRR